LRLKVEWSSFGTLPAKKVAAFVMEISYFVRTAVPSLLSTPSTQFCDHGLSHLLLFSEQDQLLTILILHITPIHSVTATMQISNNKTFAKGMQK
jgi:hypothetical protein